MKTVIITGASSGIGLCAARRFAAENWRVVLLARRKNVLEAVAAELPGARERHIAVDGDYSREETAGKLVQCLHCAGITAVDALVNCAGVIASEPIVGTDLSAWRAPFDTLLNGAILMTRTVVRYADELRFRKFGTRNRLVSKRLYRRTAFTAPPRGKIGGDCGGAVLSLRSRCHIHHRTDSDCRRRINYNFLRRKHEN